MEAQHFGGSMHSALCLQFDFVTLRIDVWYHTHERKVIVNVIRDQHLLANRSIMLNMYEAIFLRIAFFYIDKVA